MNNTTRKGEVLTAVDVGSSHIKVLVAEPLPENGLVLHGVSEIESRGIQEGKVVDIEKASASLSNALKEVEIMSARKVGEVLVSIAGEEVGGRDATGQAVIADEEVNISDITKVKEMARTDIADHNAFRVIDTLEKNYTIDDSPGIRQPLGMSGRKISGDMHLVIASRNSLANLEKCVLLAGISHVRRFVFSPLAAARSVLSEDEKELGVCLADIGAGTTDMVVYRDGMVFETQVSAIAGDDIHRDIAHMHHASLEAAQRAKHDIGLAGEGEEFAVLLDASGNGENKVGRAVVRDTIGHRVDEILENIEQQLVPFRSRGGKLSAGLVLVGDGALLPGLAAVAEKKLSLPVRVGYPRYRGEKHELVAKPRFAVGVGLLQMLAENRREEAQHRAEMGVWERCKNLWRQMVRDE